jgi:hypothetical protein
MGHVACVAQTSTRRRAQTAGAAGAGEEEAEAFAMMDETDQEHFQRELSDRRQAHRGGILRLVAYFECANGQCPVGEIRVKVVERLGQTRPMQKYCRCPRCQGVLAFVRLEY